MNLNKLQYMNRGEAFWTGLIYSRDELNDDPLILPPSQKCNIVNRPRPKLITLTIG